MATIEGNHSHKQEAIWCHIRVSQGISNDKSRSLPSIGGQQAIVKPYRQCYRNCENWQNNLANCCNAPNSLFITAKDFY